MHGNEIRRESTAKSPPSTTYLWGVKVHERACDFRADRPIVLTVGTFDGVHAGHRAVLAALGRIARELDA
ncbi:MAG: hypothetical protein ACO3YQ_02895, partial [Flavobacteriales bacterium]